MHVLTDAVGLSRDSKEEEEERAMVVGQDAEQDGDEENGTASEFNLEDLPPMPAPNLTDMRSEACFGCLFVLFLIGTAVGIPHAVAPELPTFHAWDAKAISFACLYGEALIALLCLLGLMLGDPGVLKRSRETCFPLPEAVAERLHEGKSLQMLENIRGRDGREFCIRCCIWRPRDSGRCVAFTLSPVPCCPACDHVNYAALALAL